MVRFIFLGVEGTFDQGKVTVVGRGLLYARIEIELEQELREAVRTAYNRRAGADAAVAVYLESRGAVILEQTPYAEIPGIDY